MKQQSPWFAVGGTLFCVWQARDLSGAWRHAPFDRFDPLAFALWVVPVVIVCARERGKLGINPTMLVLAAVLTFLGSAVDMNVLHNLALAAALGSFVISELPLVPWLLAAPAWMPVFGWVGSGWGFAAVALARLTIAGAASAWGCWRLARLDKVGVA